MARRSRSKQRGKGVGSRSQSAGKSKGGSRSSAGSKGGSKSGGNRSGSGARGNRGRSSSPSRSKSTTSSKSTKSTKSPSSKSPTKKLSGREKAQQIAKQNIAKYGGTASAAAANRESMRVNARSRYLASQTGIPSGKNLPAGSFGISEAGRAQAAANRTAAREAKIAKMSPRQQAMARRAYEKYGTINPTFADTFGATSGDLRNPLNAPNYAAAMGAGYTDSVVGGLNFAKNLIPGVKQLPNIPTLPAYNDARLQNLRNISSFAIPGAQLTSSLSNLGKVGSLANIGKKGLSIRNAQAGFTGMDKTGFNAIRSGDKFRAGTMKVFGRSLPKPQILGGGRAYSAPSADRVRGLSLGARRYSLGTGSLGGKQEAGGVIGSIVPGGARRLRMIEAQASVPGRTFDKGVTLARRLQGQSLGTDKIANPNLGAYGRSALANRLRTQLNTGVAPGTGGIGGAEVGSSLAAASAMTTKATKAGGLNIGGVDSEDTGNNNLARALSFAAKNPGAVVQDAGMIAGELASGDLSIGDIRQGIGDYRDVMAGDTLRDKVENFANIPNERKERYLTQGLDLADRSAIVQRIGEQAGLPSDFKAQTKELGSEIGRRLSTVKAGDRDSTYKAISDFSRDIGTDPKLGLAGRMAESFRTRKGTTMEKIASGYDKNSPTIKGLSAAERGIVGSVGNRIISGKATDMAREAMSGMTPGASLTRGNIATIGTNIMRDTAPGADTLSAKRASQIKSLVTGGSRGTDVTPGSLIRGVNPFRRSGQGGSNILSRPGGSGTATPVGQLPQVPNPAQVELPMIPQQQEQQGTQASTLAGIQNQSYENTFNNLMAQFRPRRMGRRRNFRTSFNRDYFSQFV